MTRRGGEGKYGRLHVFRDPVLSRTYNVYDENGRRVGTAVRERHTVRTTYKGTRIGYESTHWCWSDRDFRHNGQWQSLSCYRTLDYLVKVMDRLWHDAG